MVAQVNAKVHHSTNTQARGNEFKRYWLLYTEIVQ